MPDLREGSGPVRLAAFGGAVATGILILVLKIVIGVEGEPTTDVATEAEIHALTGGVSQAGLLVWGITAGAAAIVGAALWQQGRREESLFLLVAAAGIAFLGLDDALLLHEDVLKNHLGIPSYVTFMVFGSVMAAWAFRFRSLVLSSDVSLLFLTGVAVGLGMTVDLFELWSVAGEDWLKYVALAGLAGWVADTCLSLLATDRGTSPGAGDPNGRSSDAPAQGA